MRHSFGSSFRCIGTNFAQIFPLPKPSVIMFQTQSFLCSADMWSLKQSTYDHQTPPALPLDLDLSSACWMPPAHSWSDLLPPCILLWTPCASQKYMRVTWCYLHSNACERVFLNRPKNSLLNDQKKNGNKQKHVSKMQLFYKA